LVTGRGVHGRADGAVEVGAVDTLGESVGDRVLGAREVQCDAVVLERAGQVFERLQAGGVDVRHRLGVLGFLFLMVAVLSFTRAVQRMIEQTWELESLSVRNTFNGLLWIGGLVLGLALTGILHAVLGRSGLELSAALLVMPLTAAFLVWSGRILSAKRIERHDLLPFGILGAVLLGLYSVGATVYVPHLFHSYTTRYGVIGAVFAILDVLLRAA